MPPNTIMHGGTLPLSLPFRSSPPPTPTPAQFTQTLLLDSTRLLAGLLRSANAVEYAIATSGSTTVITQPEQSRNVAVVRWKERVVESNGLRMQFGEWMKTGKWSGTKTHMFKKWGRNPEIKWTARGAEWEATNAKNQVLASFVLRRGALGTRLEFTALGEEYADAVVVTGLLGVTGEQEWMWYGYLREKMEAARRNAGAEGGTREDEAEGVGEQAESPPTYREAPFTRPLGPLLQPTLTRSSEADTFGPPTDNPISLTLSSRQLLSGTFCEEDQPVVSIRTTGPATTIKWFGRVVASIEWAAGRVEIDGETVAMDDIIGKKSLFKTKKSHTCVFPNLSFTWSETSRTSTASIYPDPNAYVRYACRTVSTNRPLGVFTHYARKGSLLELTPEGHAALAEVLVGLLVGLCRGEWKRVAGVGVAMGGSGETGELVVGEEMVSDLDGWAGPVELMQLRQETPQVG